VNLVILPLLKLFVLFVLLRIINHSLKKEKNRKISKTVVQNKSDFVFKKWFVILFPPYRFV
jgi:hypothetical protein